ncbi:MAG: hypothetical protein IJD04_03955 [Desulfovibrionaceae bacterium]|nr:hypothetical protein [Desulfovibrionaceae bacterium]
MNFNPYQHLERYERCGPSPAENEIMPCRDSEECLFRMRRVLADIRSDMEKTTDWLPFSYKAYFYGATADAPDCLYFCITDEPVSNLGQPLDFLLGEVMPDWFYVRLHIVRHAYVHFKIDNPVNRTLRCEIHCPGNKNMVRPISCIGADYMTQVNMSLSEYLDAAFPA